MIELPIHPPKQDGQPDTAQTLVVLVNPAHVVSVSPATLPSQIIGGTKPGSVWAMQGIGTLVSPMSISEAKDELTLATKPRFH